MIEELTIDINILFRLSENWKWDAGSAQHLINYLFHKSLELVNLCLARSSFFLKEFDINLFHMCIIIFYSLDCPIISTSFLIRTVIPHMLFKTILNNFSSLDRYCMLLQCVHTLERYSICLISLRLSPFCVDGLLFMISSCSSWKVEYIQV